MSLALGLLLVAASALASADSNTTAQFISEPQKTPAEHAPANGTESHTSPLLADVHSDDNATSAAVDEDLVRSPRQTRVQVHITPTGMTVIRPTPIIIRPVRRPASPPPPPPPPVPIAHLLSDVLSQPAVVHSTSALPVAHYTSAIVHGPPGTHFGPQPTLLHSNPVVYHKGHILPSGHFVSGNNSPVGPFSSATNTIHSTGHPVGHFGGPFTHGGTASPGSHFTSSPSTSTPNLYSSPPSQISTPASSSHYSTLQPPSNHFVSSSTHSPNSVSSAPFGSQSQFQSGRQQVQFTLQDSIPLPGGTFENKHVPRDIQSVDSTRGQHSQAPQFAQQPHRYLPQKNNNAFVNQLNPHDFKFPHLSTTTTPRPYGWEDNIEGAHSISAEPSYRSPEGNLPFRNSSAYSDTSFPRLAPSDSNYFPNYPRPQTTVKPPQLGGYSPFPTSYYPPVATKEEPSTAAQEQKQFHALKTNSPLATERTKATLKEVLAQDCVDAERNGFCASPPRYPSHQVSQMIRQCGQLLRAIFAPLPSQPASSTTTQPYKERANREVWSWAKNASAAAGSPERRSVCASDAAQVLPGYARDASSGRWLVVLQAAGHIVQPVAVDVCRHPGKPCSGLSKCTRGGSGGFRHSYKASQCEQRHSYAHLVTWDPDTPQQCPRLSVVRLPSACVCQLEAV